MDAQQTRMLKKVKQGKAVLFLGAGASRAANAPTAEQLGRMIHEEFLPGSRLDAADFMEVCSNVLDTPGVDRIAVEDFIRAKLDVQPSHWRLALSQNRWQAIFTTNFDDIVETAYRITPNRVQWCEPVSGKDFSRTQSDYRDMVRLFKLMGSVTAANEESRMALSRGDYNWKLRQRGGLFRLLYDFVKDGTIAYTLVNGTRFNYILINEFGSKMPK
jgi:SIR2-like domain